MRDITAAFHQSNESSDIHSDKGRHRTYENAFENGELVQTVLPDFALQADLLNGWLEAEDLPGESFAAAAGVLKRLLLWQIQSDADRPRHLSSIARRTIALAFAICPDQIPWQSLQECADEFHATKQSFGKYSKEILQLANGNFQRSGMFRGTAHRQARAETSRRQWDRRGRLPSSQKRRVRAAWVKENPQLHEAELEKRRAIYAARQAKRALSGA
jgi:hypothetical protein